MTNEWRSSPSDDSESQLSSISSLNADRILDESGSIWTEEQLSVMREHRSYWLDTISYAQHMIECITSAQANGPMEEKDVVKKWNLVKPASDLYGVICKGRRNKLQKRVLNDRHHYLCGKLVESDEVFDSSVDNNRYSTKDDMIVYLKEKYNTLGEKTNILLREHVKFGKELKRARKEFMKNRKKWCITDKWEK